MQDAIVKIKNDCIAQTAAAANTKDISDVKVRFLGKSGEFTLAMRLLKDVPKEEKPAFGKMLNDARVEAEAFIAKKEAELKAKELEERLKAEKVDVTLPAKNVKIGSLHPLTQVKNEILDTFISLGFEVLEGPEIETDEFCFQKLNIPKDHPARDMQDTFYITDNVVLRTHTSPMQARTMLAKKPPLRLVVPGKVFRSDDDSTHSPMFNQIEGLVVDKKVSLCDLKGALEEFAKAIFSPETKVRFRPSYFPFTEPSVEVDVSCSICGGKGCKVCKHTGWIEILGAGIVNPQVLINCGLDPQKYSGYAFGLGIERVTMIKYGIPDIRLLFENDSRFLNLYK